MLTFSKLVKKPEALRRLTGLPLPVFVTLCTRFAPLWEAAEHERRNYPDRLRKIGAGHPYKLATPADKLLLFLAYCRQSLTYEFAGLLFDLDCSNVRRLVLKMAPVVEQAADAHLATYLQEAWNKRQASAGTTADWEALLARCPELEQVAVDTAQQVRLRPGNARERTRSYSGKVQDYTIKTGLVVGASGRIVHVTGSYPGPVPDQTVYERENWQHLIPPKTRQFADLGFQGVQHLCPHSDLRLPFKRKSPGRQGRGRKGPPLTRGQKQANGRRRRQRVIVENRLAAITGFRILHDTWRSRVERHNPIFRAVAALTNLRLAA